MIYQSPYEAFVFEDYSFDPETNIACFKYSFDSKRYFTEKVNFHTSVQEYDKKALENALQLAFLVTGTSYYKAFPTRKVVFKKGILDDGQADFARKVYTHGLSQFMFENSLSIDDMPKFTSRVTSNSATDYQGRGIIALQSGGKDSLLLATLLEEQSVPYTSLYISSGEVYPLVLDTLSSDLQIITRSIDRSALAQSQKDGGLNGHVPVTYIVLSYALIMAVLQNKKTVLSSIGAEGGEAHEHIVDLPVNHQWSKTWEAEQLLAKYVARYVSPSLQVGSPLRGFSELRIAELFVAHSWERFGQSFSSCNRANYLQGQDNQTLKWCGLCPKCANSYLLFAAFVEPTELKTLFNGKDLFQKPELVDTFKGLLGIDNVMKPFECVGEVAELRTAFRLAQNKYGDHTYKLPFEVPSSSFDYILQRKKAEWVSSILAPVY